MNIDNLHKISILLAISSGERGPLSIEGINQERLNTLLEGLQKDGLVEATRQDGEPTFYVRGLTEWGGFYVDGLRLGNAAAVEQNVINEKGELEYRAEAVEFGSDDVEVVKGPSSAWGSAVWGSAWGSSWGEPPGPAGSAEARAPATDRTRFALVQARVAALEVALAAVREPTPGIGHNRGPSDFEPASENDLVIVDRVVAVLKEQSPTTVVNREELVETQRVGQILTRKIGEYTDEYFKAFAKQAGTETAKIIKWVALASALSGVLFAVFQWLHAHSDIAIRL